MVFSAVYKLQNEVPNVVIVIGLELSSDYPFFTPIFTSGFCTMHVL